MNVFGVTDVGRVRRDNQDSYAICPIGDEAVLLVVCDGMGGARAGSVASAVAAETFTNQVEEALAGGVPEDPALREQVLCEACRAAIERVHRLSLEHREYEGMGTTLVAALAVPGAVCFVNVGDSRGYVLSNMSRQQVTVDHSLVQLLVERGEITSEEARVHPKKNLITRALGVDRRVACDLLRVEAGPNSRLLLCSDGLSNVLPDQVLLRVSMEEPEPEGMCRRLLDMTLEQGAPDNVTVVLAQL